MEIFMMETSDLHAGGNNMIVESIPQVRFWGDFFTKSAEIDSSKCWLNGFSGLVGMASNFGKM